MAPAQALLEWRSDTSRCCVAPFVGWDLLEIPTEAGGTECSAGGDSMQPSPGLCDQTQCLFLWHRVGR